MRRFIVCYIWLLFSPVCAAQQDAVILQHITAKNGLTGNGINALLKDKRGFLWIATSDGLNRFDGKQIKTFRYHPGDSQTISHNWVTALINDESGNIWIGTRNGVCLINPFSLVIKRIFPEKITDRNDVLLVNSLVVAPDGKIWAATGKGFFIA